MNAAAHRDLAIFACMARPSAPDPAVGKDLLSAQYLRLSAHSLTSAVGERPNFCRRRREWEALLEIAKKRQKPPASICICRDGIWKKRSIRSNTYRFPVSPRRTTSITAQDKNEPAHRGGGRHPPRAGRPFPGSVSEQLGLSATQGLSGHSTLPHGCVGRPHRCLSEVRSPGHLLYFHVVFTVPHELNVLAMDNQRAFYDLLFTASAKNIAEGGSRSQTPRCGNRCHRSHLLERRILPACLILGDSRSALSEFLTIRSEMEASFHSRTKSF
jgi:hypothetical protein